MSREEKTVAALPPPGLIMTEEDFAREGNCNGLNLPPGVPAPPSKIWQSEMVIVDHSEYQRTYRYCGYEWPRYWYLSDGSRWKKTYEPTVQILKTDVLGQFEKYFVQVNWDITNYYRPTKDKQERLLLHLMNYSSETYYGSVEILKGYHLHKCGEIKINERIEVETNWLPLVEACRLELASAETYTQCT
ncbi:hypothetical protein [Ruegeria arenilitoris]|uniref:hypothetical protein n=1 Tax=Ruegeria arenilitoris TaxID=1173585 RepID=UPI00147D339E|nr:hypothetical protein [Ruegeria arenilitoris]